MASISKQDFKNFFKYYKSEAQQEAGVEILFDQIRDVLKDDEHAWITTYRDKPKSSVSTDVFTPDSPFNTKVTANFAYSELTNGGKKKRDVLLVKHQCEVAVEICEFLEKARAKFGPISITSAHRPPAINAAVGGVSNSEHLYSSGCGAVDAYPINGDEWK